MRWHFTIRSLGLLSLLAAGLCAQTGPPAADEGSGNSILVLLSGEVIQGRISRLDDKYNVGLPTGRIFVPEDSVEIVCNDLHEAFRYRRSRMGQGQVQDHAELAQWCQRHGLDTEAEAELAIAKRLDPDHPIVGLVERRLLASRLSHATPQTQPAQDGSAEPTPQQLEEFAAGLPSGTVETFTRVVQPLLINRCATSGCHTDRSDNEFRLNRSRPGVPLGRTSTNRNLHATLRLIDAAAPDQCELLRPKRCPHRLQSESAFSLSKSSQYKYLVAWVSLLTLSGLSEKPSELMVTAMIRARMSELLAEASGRGAADACFTAGLFSALDALLDIPMEQVLESLPLTEELTDALLQRSGSVGEVLGCVIAYERGEWDTVHLAGLGADSIRECYLQALAWSNKAGSQLEL